MHFQGGIDRVKVAISLLERAIFKARVHTQQSVCLVDIVILFKRSCCLSDH